MAVAMPSKHLLFERVPTSVSCDVTSENLRNVYNKEYLQPLLAICNQSCTILSICGIVLSSSSFLWASEGIIFFWFTGDVLLLFFLQRVDWNFLPGEFFSGTNSYALLAHCLGVLNKKIIYGDATFVHWFSDPLQNLRMGVSNFGQEKWKQKERKDVVFILSKQNKKRTIQIFTYEFFIQNNNLNIKKININKLNKTSARIIDNFSLFVQTQFGGKCANIIFFVRFWPQMFACSHILCEFGNP